MFDFFGRQKSRSFMTGFFAFRVPAAGGNHACLRAATRLRYRLMTIEPEKDLLDVRAGRDVSFFDLYSIDQVSLKDIGLIFGVARKFRDHQTYKFSFNKGCSMVH